MKCSHILSNGDQCGAFAMNDSNFCINHNPEAKELKKLAVLKGGQTPKKIVKNSKLPAVYVGDKKDVAPFLIKLIDEVRSGKIDNRKANTLGYISGMLIKAYELAELEGRLEQIEQIVLERRTIKRNY